MYYTLVSTVPDLKYNEATDKMIESAEDVISYADESIMEFVDSILECFWNSTKGIGVFSECELYNKVEAYAAEKINQIVNDLCFTANEYDDSNRLVRSVIINIEQELRQYISNRIDDADSWACYYVEECLRKFAHEGLWHLAIRSDDGEIIEDLNSLPVGIEHNGTTSWFIDNKEYVPCLWFGMSGEEPLTRWMITNHTTDDELVNNFCWNETDGSNFLLTLGEFSDGFCIFYDGECVCSIPDSEEIWAKCPIDVEDHSSVRVILSNTAKYIIERTRQ